MLAGRPVGVGTAQARQPRPVLAALAAAAIVGPVVFAVVAVVQGLLRPGFSFVAHPVVALVAGPSGWVQDLNFVVLGAAMIAVLSRPMAADPSWRRLGGYALTTGIAILVVIPIHSVLALPADGPLHPWWSLFNWSAITLWLTCTLVLARRLLRVATAAPPRSQATTTEPEGQAAPSSTTW